MTQKEKIAGYDKLSDQNNMLFLALSDVLNDKVYWIKKGKLGICRWNSSPIVLTNTSYWMAEPMEDFHSYWTNYDGSYANEEIVKWRDLACSVRGVFNKLLSGDIKI